MQAKEEEKEEEINKKDTKKFILPLKEIKQVENTKKKEFDKLTDVLLSYCLFPFFKIKEAKEIGKVNSKFYNSFVRYYDRICIPFINKYNVKIENEYKPNEIYEQKDDKGHFIKLSLLNLEHYLLFSYFDWAWKNDEKYWDTITPKNSILNKNISHLIRVCWLDVNGSISHIFNGKYKLYLNHCVCKLLENRLKMTVLLDNVPIQEFKYPSKEQLDKCHNLHLDKNEEEKKEEDKKEEDKKEEDKKEEDKKKGEEKEEKGFAKINLPHLGLMRNPLFRIGGGIRKVKRVEYNKDNSLQKEFIMDLNVNYDEQLDNSSGHVLTVKFDHVEGSWKNGWLIDAVILEREDSL